MNTVCCELCTVNILKGTIWKVKTARNGIVIICDDCHSAVRFAEEEKYDGRHDDQKRKAQTFA